MSGESWQDLSPEARAEIERAVAWTSTEIAATTASIAKPYRDFSRVSYMDTPIAACAHFPSRPGKLGKETWERERAGISRRDNWTIAGCIALLLLLALGAWLW